MKSSGQYSTVLEWENGCISCGYGSGFGLDSEGIRVYLRAGVFFLLICLTGSSIMNWSDFEQ